MTVAQDPSRGGRVITLAIRLRRYDLGNEERVLPRGCEGRQSGETVMA